MQKISYGVASPAKNSPAGHTPHHRNSKPYRYHGHSPHGDSTWLAHSRNPQKKEEHTYWSQSTSSPNGSKQYQSPAQQPSRQLSSSNQSSSDSEYHTTSSQTMAQTSQQQNSKTIVKSWASKSTTHQTHTRSPMAKWRKQTA